MRYSLLMLLAVFSISNSYSKCPKEIQHQIPITAFMKNGSTVSGRGCLSGSFILARMCKEVLIDGKKIVHTETDSITIHYVTGITDSSGWLFRVIEGPISAYAYDISTWMHYRFYPASHCSSKVIEITEANTFPKGHNYVRSALSYEFWKYLKRLENSIKYFEYINDGRKVYNDTLMKEIVKEKTTSYLYTEKVLTRMYDISILSIVDFNMNLMDKQPYIESLFSQMNSYRKGSKDYRKIFKQLKKTFITYDDYNVAAKHSLYLDNGKVVLKNGNELIGHVRIKFGDGSVSQGVDAIQFTENSKFYRTISIDGMNKRGIDYKKAVTGLLIDGFEMVPKETMVITISGFEGAPENEIWRFKSKAHLRQLTNTVD